MSSNNSTVIVKKVKIFGLLLFWSVLLAVAPGVKGQMFSVGEPEARNVGPFSEVYLGLENMQAAYKGDPDVNGEKLFEYDGPVFKAGYQTTGLNLFLSAGGEITGVDDRSYFHTGGSFDFGISLYRSEKIRLQIPLRISSRYTNITNNQRLLSTNLNRFQFGMLSGGIGLNGILNPTEKVRIKLGAVPGYGFSFATGGLLGGSVGVIDAFGKLYFDRLINDYGIAIGYNYDFRGYDVEGNVYDYDLSGHSIEIGVTF